MHVYKMFAVFSINGFSEYLDDFAIQADAIDEAKIYAFDIDEVAVAQNVRGV